MFYDQTVAERDYDPLAQMRVSREEFLSVFLTEQKQPEWLQQVLTGHPVAVAEPIEWEDDDDQGVEVVVFDAEAVQQCEYPDCDFEATNDDDMLDHMEDAHPEEE